MHYKSSRILLEFNHSTFLREICQRTRSTGVIFAFEDFCPFILDAEILHRVIFLLVHE